VQDADTRPEWRRSGFCGSSACVEVATIADSFLVRDSKNPEGPVLSFDRTQWGAFMASMKTGSFDFQ